MLPTVSVVVPTYNGEAWIAETLDSVFRQTHLPIEIVVVDDASSDDTAGRVAALAINSPVPVQLVRRDTNSGSPAPTLNTGVERSTGELIAVLDQDDLFLPNKLERQAQALSANPDMSLVFSLFGKFSDGRPGRDALAASARVRGIRRRMTEHDGVLRCEGSTALEEFARSINFVGGFPGFMFRRAAWASKGGFDESLRIAADYEFLCWLCTQGAVGFVPELHYLRREHGENLTLRTGVRWRLDAITVLLNYIASSDTLDIRTIVRDTIHHHLWAIARRLSSAGHRQAAGEIATTVSQMMPSGWRALLQRLAIPAYVGFCRVFRRPWQIDTEQADDAVELSKTVARRLASL